MSIALHKRATHPPERAPERTPSAAAVVVALPMPACTRCPLWQLCTPCKPLTEPMPGTEKTVFARRRLATGDTLFNEGDAFHAIYAVRCGSMKSIKALPGGRDQVIGFLIAGDVLALDGMATGRHASTVVAIEDTQVCAVGYASLSGAMKSHPTLQHDFSRQLSLEIVRSKRVLLLLGSLNAQERVAAFLLDLSRRFSERGQSPRAFNLRMTRAEIGSFLGLQLETVSRTFSMFQQQGVLTVDNRLIRFTDLESFAEHFEAVLQG